MEPNWLGEIPCAALDGFNGPNSRYDPAPASESAASQKMTLALLSGLVSQQVGTDFRTVVSVK